MAKCQKLLDAPLTQGHRYRPLDTLMFYAVTGLKVPWLAFDRAYLHNFKGFFD
jgi:hypothetical protein